MIVCVVSDVSMFFLMGLLISFYDKNHSESTYIISNDSMSDAWAAIARLLQFSWAQDPDRAWNALKASLPIL